MSDLGNSRSCCRPLDWPIFGSVSSGSERPTIAYGPRFLQQVRAGHVSEISSTDTGEIQGAFRASVRVSGASVTDLRAQAAAGLEPPSRQPVRIVA